MSVIKKPLKSTSLIFLSSIISGVINADVLTEITLSDIKEPSELYSTALPTVLKMSVKTVIESGSNCIVGDYKACTFQDVLNDIDSDDDFKPEVKVIFTADDFVADSLPSNAKIRQRGGHTRFLPLKSFRIKLDSKKDLWRNERRIQLVKSFDDATKIRNKLSYDLFADIPNLPSMRTQFVQLDIDNATSPVPDPLVPNSGPDLGLFTHIEHVGKEYLKNRGWEKDSRAYKAEHFTFQEDHIALALDAEGKPVDEKKFEYILEIKTGKNHKKLNEMLAAVNDTSLDFQKDIFNKYFDKDNYLTWYAINILVNNADTSNHNFYIYNPKSSDKFYFLPWDYDYAWGAHLDGTGGLTANDMPPWWYSHAYRWDDNLHRQFLQKAGNLDLLKQAVTEIKNKYLTRNQIKGKIDQYRGLTEPLVTAKPDDHWGVYENDPQKVANYDKVLDRLVSNVEVNYSRFINNFDNPMPFYSYEPEITLNTTLPPSNTKSVRFDWDSTVSLQGNDITYDLIIYAAKTENIIDPPNPPTPIVVPGDVVEIKTDISNSDYLMNWVHKAGTYYYKVIARDITKPNENWQISYDETIKDVNGFPIHGVIKFEISKNGVGSLPVVSNVAPIAYNQSISALSKNGSTEITLIASDAVERNKLSFAITVQPSNGTLTLDASNMSVVYKANNNATGVDSFKFKVNDGTADSNEATVSLIINEPPVATNRIVTPAQKNKDVEIDLTTNTSDADGDALSLLISQQPTNGTLSAVSNLTIRYTPKANYAGKDSFIYRVKDVNGLYSKAAIVSLTVLNKEPTVKNQSITLKQDTKKDILLEAKDADKDALKLTITQKPAHGSLKIVSGLLVNYAPNKGYAGSDSFKYKVNDKTLDSTEATVNLTITKVAVDAPKPSSGGGSSSWLFLLFAYLVMRFKKSILKV